MLSYHGFLKMFSCVAILKIEHTFFDDQNLLRVALLLLFTFKLLRK